MVDDSGEMMLVKIKAYDCSYEVLNKIRIHMEVII